MAITSVGYDGAVNEVQWARLAVNMGAAYGVDGATSFEVTSVPGQNQTVSVKAGTAFGHGVLDVSDTAVTLQLAAVATGSRWDLIALRRDWQGITGGPTSVVAVQGTSAKTIPATRKVGPGVLDDQPLALVQITAGQTLPTAVVDLRVWHGNGGVQAKDTLALGYLDRIGSAVRIFPDLWRRSIDTLGSSVWVKESLNSLPMHGVGSGVNGPTPLQSFDYKVQAGTIVATSDALAYVRVYFPVPFPNGVLTVMLTGGDAISNPGIVFACGWQGGPAYNPDNFVYQVRGGAGWDGAGASGVMFTNYLHRVNWLAIGY